jgi:hypothetical protein
LKGIGIVKDDRKETYQDSVTAPLSWEHDDDAGGDVDGLEEDIAAAEAPLGQVLAAIPKMDFIFGLHVLDLELICASLFQLRNIIQAVHSSPQWQEAWLEEANAFLQKTAIALSVVLGCAATMLILDIKTQWSSTHQMLCKAFTYRDAFIQK